MTDLDELHDVKGLAVAIKRAPSYVYDMKSAGFQMPGDRASMRQAHQWLADHPDFTRAQAAELRFARRAKTCTEPDRQKCPRFCIDFCNAAEEAKANGPSEPRGENRSHSQGG
ncbi:MAG TPA: hypothetical protein DDZ88_25440 [Verrucomicrobiales bacterium]|nr:hypothetical protein [Verrucomicrobiales bacterium]